MSNKERASRTRPRGREQPGRETGISASTVDVLSQEIPAHSSVVRAQTTQIGNRQLPLAHRQAVAEHIGRTHGNRHLQRVVGDAATEHATEERPSTAWVSPSASSAAVQRHSPGTEGGQGAGGGPSAPVEQTTSGAEMDALTAQATMMSALLGSVKAIQKFKHKVVMNKSLGPYATLKSLAVGLAGELGISAKGSAVMVGRSSGESTSTKSTMQEYGRRKTELDKQGQATASEVSVKVTDTVNDLFSVDLKDATIKWIGESFDEKEIKGTIDVQGKADNGLLAGLKLDVYNLNLEDPTKSSAGTVTPYAGWEGSLPLISIQPPALDWVTFPPIEVTGKVKVTGEAEIQPNTPAILLELAKRFGPKIAERIALATGSKAAGPIAARIVSAAQNVFSIPGMMIASGIMSVLTVIDAFMEGDRIKNLGTLAQRLAMVYAGAYVGEWNGQGGASMGGDSATAQFASAGAAVALQHKDDVLAKVKQQAVQEELPVDGQAAEIWKTAVEEEIKNNPTGIGDILPAAQGPVDQYILDRWTKGREEAWTRKGMNIVLGVFGMGLGEVKGSAEYEKFKGDYLQAYTTDKAYQVAIEQATTDLEKEGRPVTPENVNEALYGYFTKKAQESEQELQ
ncbi:MAG: hypothetical protein JW934_07520 [Anaerolineae bacterium]|nr:hypothetical protein [Anaerolineae bacterium]